MSEINNLMDDIEKLRTALHELINQKEKLHDPEVVAASQILNAAITKYNELIVRKNKSSQ